MNSNISLFLLLNEIINLIKIMRYYGTRKILKTVLQVWYFDMDKLKNRTLINRIYVGVARI